MLARLSYLALLVLLIVNPYLQGAPWAFYLWSLPLIIFSPGIISGTKLTLIYMCCVTLVYFYIAIDNLAGPAPNPLDHAELVATVTLFVSSLVWVRCQQILNSVTE